MVIKLNRNNRFIIGALFLTLLIVLISSVGFIRADKVVYLSIYLLLSIICFLISFDWISTLTLFWLQYTIYALGYVTSKTVYLYNPYFVVLGSFGILLFGYYMGHNTKYFRIKQFKIKRSQIIKLKWKTIIEMMYVYSTIMWGVYILKNRAFLFGENLESGRVDAMSGNGIFLYSVMLHVMYIPMLYILLKKREISIKLFCLLVIISCFELICVGYRTPLVISVFCIFVIQARLKKFNVKDAVFWFLILFVLAMGFEIIRSGSVFSTSSLMQRFLSRFDCCMWNYNYVVTTFPHYMPFQHGYTNIIDLIMLLPGPGQDFSLWLKDAVGITYDGGGFVTFIQGSFYIDFGIPGMIIGMFFLGYFKAFVDWWLEGHIETSFWDAYIPYAFSMVCGNIMGTFILPMVLFVVYKFMEYFAIGDLTIKRLDINMNRRE